MKQNWTDWRKKRNQKKQKKAKKRYKKERRLQKNHPFIVSFWKKNVTPAVGITIAFSTLLIGLLLYSMWMQYQDSVYWEDHHDENIAMAKRPPSLLYDADTQSRDAKMNFLSIYHTVYDEERLDFTEQIEQEAIDQLSVELVHMTDDEYKTEYQTMFDAIGEKWHIEQQYRALYAEDGVVAKTVTPHQIVALNEEVYPTLDQYSKDTWNEDQFAIRIYEWQHALLADAQTLNEEALTLSQWLSNDDEAWTVQPDLYPAQFNNYVEALEETETTFEWQSMNYLTNVVEAIQPITELYAERHDLYVRIQEDQADKETALANVEQQLDTAQANLNQELTAIDSERTTMIASADSLRTQQATIQTNMETLEENATARAEAIRQAAEDERLAEERRQEAEAEAERQEEVTEEPSIDDEGDENVEDWGDQETTDEPEETEDERTQDEELTVHHGQPARDVFDALDEEFTYERQGVDPSLEQGVIETHYLNDNGIPHFIVVPSETGETS